MYEMHVVIGGCGRVGSYLSHALEYEGHSVAIIDKDPLAFEVLSPGFRGITVEGIVFDRRALEQAGIERADAYLAVTSGDNSNIVSARVAKEYYHVPKVCARIYDPRRAEIYRGFGIPTIASVAWSSYRLLDLISHPELHGVYQFGNGEIQLLEVALPPNLSGKTVEDLEIPDEIHVTSVVRGHKAFLPTRGTILEKDDLLFISAAQESLGKLERLLGLR